MNDEAIQYISPLISELLASEILNPPKKWWHLRKKLLKRIELVFMPVYYFELVTESTKSGMQQVSVIVDGISGVFSLYDRIVLTNESPLNIPAFQFDINPQQAQQICLNEYRRVLLNYNMRKHAFIELKEILIQNKLFFPFWIGYFQVGKKYDFEAIDAVNGKSPGVKMRSAFLSAFTQWKTQENVK